jgi:hypothetical protein
MADPPAAPAVPITSVTTVGVTSDGGALALQWGIFFDSEIGRAGDEVDLVDCAGWLARARLTSDDADPIGWKIEVLAADPEPAPCRGAGGWNAFAILPADPRREGRRATGGDPAATFASLPEDVRAWATVDHGIAQHAHLDDDGAIDLVEVQGLCKPNDEYTCGKILVREGAAWRQVGYTTPL